MPQHRARTPEGSVSSAASAHALTRREVVAGGGLALGAFLLSGCAGGGTRNTGGLPNLPRMDAGPQTVYGPVGHPAPAPFPKPIAVAGPIPDLVPSGVISRSQWARFGVARKDDIFDMNGIRRITVHHDGMPPTALATSRQVAARIEQIRQSHVVGRGWADLGYHYVIDPAGRIWEGRSIRYQGAHVKDQNENNLGVLVMGNFDQQTPTPAALAALDRFLAGQMQQYRIALSAVRTHMERAPTACPGRNLQQYMVRTRSGGGNLLALATRAGLARG